MKKIGLLVALSAATLALTGCGDKVEVPPASKGMILGQHGFEGDIIPPSRFRLDPCLFYCDKLVVVEAGDTGVTEEMTVLMPKDNLMLGADVRFTLGLSADNSKLLAVFDRITPQYLESGNFGTTLDQVYSVYGAAVVRNVVRSVS